MGNAYKSSYTTSEFRSKYSAFMKKFRVREPRHAFWCSINVSDEVITVSRDEVTVARPVQLAAAAADGLAEDPVPCRASRRSQADSSADTRRHPLRSQSRREWLRPAEAERSPITFCGDLPSGEM